MTEYRVWVVDDEESIREGIHLALTGEYEIVGFPDAESALALLGESRPDLVLLDVGLPGMDGVTALARMREKIPGLLVIIITAYEDSGTIISAMKGGAHDYIIKPILMPALRITLRNALETIRLKKEVQALQERYLNDNFPCFIGESQSIQDLMSFIRRVAESPDTPVMILGETGTGKELVANAIHSRSPNFQGPFVAMNCAAIPDNLVESELFGYEKGAFSGATTAKKGMVEAAANGTLFLDEIGELNWDAQAKLLRFLDHGEYYRVGGTRRLQVRTRVISATNRRLEEMIENGGFRKDLYFRLGVVKIHLPSLNERKEDILLIARYFMNEFNEKFHRCFAGLSPEAEKALLEHHWVGNVRELRNAIERAVLVGRGDRITAEDLGFGEETAPASRHDGLATLPGLPEQGLDLPALLEDIRQRLIEESLARTGGNEAQAARLLGVKPHTLRYHKSKQGRGPADP